MDDDDIALPRGQHNSAEVMRDRRPLKTAQVAIAIARWLSVAIA
jgi:hypothetical protein